MVNFLSELEVHKIVPIRSQSREDFEAIKLLNLMHMMSLLNEGMVQIQHVILHQCIINFNHVTMASAQ